MQREGIIYRPPAVQDGLSMWRLVRDSGVLDVNSPYCYLLLCKHFSDTCTVAEVNGELVGFVTAYLLPGRDDTLFVWQIGVASSWRREGLAIRSLKELLERDVCRNINFLEATVGATNEASRALFTALARLLRCGLSKHPCFEAAHFPQGRHESETLFRIGPFWLSKQNET